LKKGGKKKSQVAGTPLYLDLFHGARGSRIDFCVESKGQDGVLEAAEAPRGQRAQVRRSQDLDGPERGKFACDTAHLFRV
jgi:hypothetical protein